MSRLFSFLSVLFALLFLNSICAPSASAAGPTFTSGSIIAVLLEPGVSEFQVSDLGTVPAIFCQDNADNLFEREICDQCFASCVDQTFEVGACGTTGVNLLPSLPGPSLNRPFYYKKPGAVTTFLTSIPFTSPPRYDLTQVPLLTNGKPTEVFLITDSKPTGGKCIGVRTTLSFFRGSCKVCKLRKWWNSCSHKVNITSVHEWEQPCEEARFSHSGLTSFAQDDDEILSLTIMPGSGAYPAGAKFPYHPSSAGSVGLCAIDFDTGGFIGPCDFFTCNCGTSLLPGEGGGGNTFMEVCFSFFPGGSNLAPYGKPGYERFTKVCFDITPIPGA
jgi:hypothetical protein